MAQAFDPATSEKIRRAAERLQDEFRGTFSTETIDRFIRESEEALSFSRFRDFEPLFVHRFVRQRLHAMAERRAWS